MIYFLIISLLICLLGVYGIYIGLNAISLLLFPISILKIDANNISQEKMEILRKEWIKNMKGSKLLIMDHEDDYKEYLKL